MKARFLHLGFLCAATAAAVSAIYAQSPDTASSGSPGKDGKAITLSGEIGSYGELYSIDGLAGRRSPSTGRLFFRPTLTLFKALSLNFDFLLSTEGNQARQDMNQFGLNPAWSWGQAHLGDFSDNYSQYTLNGILIRGGGFFINPGMFRLGAIGGIAKRAVVGSADNGAYERYLYGGRIGVGSAEGGFVDLLFLRVRDRVSSLSSPAQTTVIDSTNPGASAIQPYGVSPEENLVVGMMSHLRFFDSRLSWNLEASGSMFTRDMRVEGDKPVSLPAWVNSIYRANVTSCAGISVRTELSMNVGGVTVRTGYKYVDPGYNSLGVASLQNDVQEFSLAPSFRIGGWSVSLNALRQNDNLLGQKLNTLVRYQFGGNLNFQPSARWSSNILGNYLTLSNDAGNDTARVSYASLMLGTNQFIQFPDGSLFQSATLSYIFQRSGDNSPLWSSMKFSSHSANAGLTIPLADNLSVSPGAGLVVSGIALQARQTTQSYTLSAQHRAFENVLTSVLSGIVSIGASATSFRSTLSSTYRLTGSASIGMILSMMNYRTRSSYGGKFNEYSASLNATQRF